MKRLSTLLFVSVLLLLAFMLPSQAGAYTLQDPDDYSNGLAEYLYTYDKDSHMQKQYKVSNDRMAYFIAQYCDALANDGAFTYLGSRQHGDYVYHCFGAAGSYVFESFTVKSYGEKLTPECVIALQYKVNGTAVYLRYSKDLSVGDKGYRMASDPNYQPPAPATPTPSPRPTAKPTAQPTARPTAQPTSNIVYVPVYITPSPKPTSNIIYVPVYITPTPKPVSPTYAPTIVTPPPVSSSQILLNIQEPSAFTNGSLVFNYTVDTPAYRQYCYKVPYGSTADLVSSYVTMLINNESTLTFAGTSYSTDGKMTYYSFTPRTGYNYGTFRAYQYGQPMTPSCCLTIGYREGLVYVLCSKTINLTDKGLSN